jgi:hypothetical protein
MPGKTLVSANAASRSVMPVRRFKNTLLLHPQHIHHRAPSALGADIAIRRDQVSTNVKKRRWLLAKACSRGENGANGSRLHITAKMEDSAASSLKPDGTVVGGVTSSCYQVGLAFRVTQLR